MIWKGGITSRAKLRKQIDFGYRLTLLEAIDDKSFYTLAKAADELISSIESARKPIKKCKEFLVKIFNKTDIDKWIGDNSITKKRNVVDRDTSNIFQMHLTAFNKNPSASLLMEILKSTKADLKSKYIREGINYSITRALKQAGLCSSSVSVSMTEQRNLIRRSGSSIQGKCLGTTLLTKGLEFDTVAILDAHKFDSPKHFYVALTRACKKLVIFTENTTLSPYVS